MEGRITPLADHKLTALVVKGGTAWLTDQSRGYRRNESARDGVVQRLPVRLRRPVWRARGGFAVWVGESKTQSENQHEEEGASNGWELHVGEVHVRHVEWWSVSSGTCFPIFQFSRIPIFIKRGIYTFEIARAG